MNKFTQHLSLVFSFLLSFTSPVLLAQSKAEPDLKNVEKQDSLFWIGYNSCNQELLGNLIADDIEFYHDKGGITKGKTEMLLSLQSLCGPDYRLRRKALDSTVQVHLLNKGGTVYGAIFTGTHQFYLSPAGKPERLDGEGLFANLWLLKDGAWKMARVFSYDHRPAKYVNNRKQIKLKTSLLKQNAGTYRDDKNVEIIVKTDQDHLLLTIGGKFYLVYPEKENLYFSRDRDLTFEFSSSSIKDRRLVIREFGEIVDEASYVPTKK